MNPMMFNNVEFTLQTCSYRGQHFGSPLYHAAYLHQMYLPSSSYFGFKLDKGFRRAGGWGPMNT